MTTTKNSAIEQKQSRAKAPGLPRLDEHGNWLDSQGVAVPRKYVPRDVVAREKMLGKVSARCQRLHSQIARIKHEVFQLIDDYLDQVARRSGEKWKGNAELLSFDGSVKVDVRISESLEFDERLQLAKTKIEHCLLKWAGSAREEIRIILRRAFQLDNKGRINMRSILTLRQYRFSDPVWQEAMELISASLRVRTSRRYLNVYLRQADGSYRLLPLNWSAIDALAPGKR